jgi:hypothetical protein
MLRVPAELRLVDDIYGDTVIVRPAKPGHLSPVLCKEWSPGSPSAREVVTDLVGADGVSDHSYFTGARTVSMDLQIFGTPLETPYSYLERLTAMAHPTRRPWLYITRDNGEEWRIQLRGNEFTIAYGRMAAAMLEVTMTFTAPTGMFESPQRIATRLIAATDTGTGQVWPETWPEDFGNMSAGIVPVTANINSSVPVEPTLRIYGPSTSPVASLPTGEKFAFKLGYAIPSAQYAEIDMRAGTVLLNGDPGNNLFTQVDWTQSTFWRLPQGPMTVNLAGDGGTLEVYWRDRRITA